MTSSSSRQQKNRPALPERTRSRTDDALAALQDVMLDAARRAHDRAEVADGVGTTVLIGGELLFSSVNDFTGWVDGLQQELEEGPCVTATTTGVAVRSRQIHSGETRWPAFTAKSRGLSLGSVVSIPLREHEHTFGSLNLYGRTAQSLDELDDAQAERIANEAMRAVSSARLIAVSAINTLRLAQAVDDRADIASAVGILMHRYRIGSDPARALLDQAARQDGVDEATAARRLLDPQPW